MDADPGTLLLHLSDIHFSRESGSVHDQDRLLRNEIERDLEECYGRGLGPVQGIFITGDIAYSAMRQEYEMAAQWIEEIGRRSGCPESAVWVVPGNHDIDRKIVRSSPLLQTMHEKLRGLPTAEADQALTRYLKDPRAAGLLYEPLAAFNEFADRYGCGLSADRPWWEHDLPLHDGSRLRLRGLNSTLLSDDGDDDGAYRLLLGSSAYTILREIGVECLTLCHHPLDWLLDRDAARDAIRALARLHLFGHKHLQRILPIGAEALQLCAGAVHPNRREPNWKPCYNFLRLSVESHETRRTLHARLSPRIFSETDQRFQADFDRHGNEHRSFRMEIAEWTRPSSSVTMQDHAVVATAYPAPAAPPDGPPDRVVIAMTPLRRLTYRFLSLPYQLRLRVAQDMRLLEADDQGVSDIEKFQRILRRAQERQQLAQLWDAVSQYEEHASDENPFRA